MWLVKQAASKVKTLSQQVLKEKPEAVKLAEDIVSNRHQVMPLRKMADLAALTFDINAFDDTLDFITTKLNDLKFERKSLKKRLNVLVLATYLIKHGASGFIDEFRAFNEQFRRYETLRNFIAEEDREMVVTMAEIRDRASYILTLLGDKAALQRQKAVARLVREKLFQGGDFTSLKQQQQQEKVSAGDKVEQFLEHYVWRYTQKLDKKLDEITDILIAKIDQYLDDEMPESFEIDETEGIISKPSFTKSEFELGGKTAIKEEIQFVQTKLQIKEENVEHDLLELAEAQKQELAKVQKQEPAAKADLLVFEQTDESTKENHSLSSNKQPAAQLEEKDKQLKDMDDDQIEAFRRELLAEQSKLQSN